MKATMAMVMVLGLVGVVFSQEVPEKGKDYTEAVVEGRQKTADDKEAQRQQELVKEIEETGAYEDGELEDLETTTESQTPIHQADPPRGVLYSDH